MIKVLFVCHGNICRSPMAEFMFKDMVQKAGVADKFEIASAAVSSEEEGNPVYPPARRVLAEHGIDCRGKYARKMSVKDYEYFDYLICMDSSNMRNMQRICGGDKDNKMYKLLDFTSAPGDVADPWYCGNFDGTWSDIHRGLTAFFDTLDIC
ncbi:MAG: low molecular weight phosphotyrosine protein phosphatase [Lentisphaeria bacterium]|nr:low molecular weight phosphotyrosine protein phosphatase [Lentisphaeria bacterium]